MKSPDKLLTALIIAVSLAIIHARADLHGILIKPHHLVEDVGGEISIRGLGLSEDDLWSQEIHKKDLGGPREITRRDLGCIMPFCQGIITTSGSRLCDECLEKCPVCGNSRITAPGEMFCDECLNLVPKDMHFSSSVQKGTISPAPTFSDSADDIVNTGPFSIATHQEPAMFQQPGMVNQGPTTYQESHRAGPHGLVGCTSGDLARALLQQQNQARLPTSGDLAHSLLQQQNQARLPTSGDLARALLQQQDQARLPTSGDLARALPQQQDQARLPTSGDLAHSPLQQQQQNQARLPTSGDLARALLQQQDQVTFPTSGDLARALLQQQNQARPPTSGDHARALQERNRERQNQAETFRSREKQAGKCNICQDTSKKHGLCEYHLKRGYCMFPKMPLCPKPKSGYKSRCVGHLKSSVPLTNDEKEYIANIPICKFEDRCPAKVDNEGDRCGQHNGKSVAERLKEERAAKKLRRARARARG